MRTKTRANQRGFSVSKKWLRHVFRINTERLHIGAVSAPCKETLAAQGIPNLIHMSSGSVESLRGLRFRINPGFFDRLEPALTSAGSKIYAIAHTECVYIKHYISHWQIRAYYTIYKAYICFAGNR